MPDFFWNNLFSSKNLYADRQASIQLTTVNVTK